MLPSFFNFATDKIFAVLHPYFPYKTCGFLLHDSGQHSDV
jgi:hypothetical protein